jgi:putative intracellular protease/amidase
MVQHVHMAVYDTLADWEVGYATAHINNDSWQREPGRYKVVTVGASLAPVTTKGGLRITPDLALDDLSPADSAMLILPGADTWLTGDNAPFAKAARAFLDAGVPVAAICGATGGLAAEGLLDDRRHTSNAREFTEAFGSKGGERYCDAPAVTDRGLITASGTAPVDFAREVFAALKLYTPEVLESWFKLYGLGDPAGFYELMGEHA